MADQKTPYPKKYNHYEVEQKWQEKWLEMGIYDWDAGAHREETFVVDTPPPTVSGSLHVGHAYSYAQTDIIVRFQRMKGKNIFYPMGWDDNGLPTERRAQNVFNIRCDAHRPYDPQWKPQKKRKSKEIELVSRQNFIEACEQITKEDEVAFENTWKKLGLSVDWSLIYTTIGSHCRRISQLSFLDLVHKGMAYNTESITMWDVDFQTAVSQAEVEDREMTGAYFDLIFAVEGGEDFVISTTRPELLPACIAVAAHPEDDRYKAYIGKQAITPLFQVPVPIVASDHADPDKGSGILMICTFGDLADVEWWRQSGLPSRQIISLDGKIKKISFTKGHFRSNNPDIAQEAYDQLEGLSIGAARKKIIELLAQPGSCGHGKKPGLKGDAKPVTHPVRFYEKGDKPLEFIPTRQWFIKILEYKEHLLEQGAKIDWHPAFMRARYDHWVRGLNQEWCISRQRYFGVPLPVWYPLDSNGQPEYSSPIYPDVENLPIDPLIDIPKDYSSDQRGKPNGFCGEEDVMDTWGTSSLTPQISSFWKIDTQRHQKLFPTDLRPQAHDIIRTWAFYTIAKAWMHEKQIPWKHVAISGFILDPDRKKMSKSKGNVVTPETLLNQHSSDVFRYWASRGRLGVDSAFDETLLKIGRKLVIKLFNASKFVLTQLVAAGVSGSELAVVNISTDLDRSWILMMRNLIVNTSKAFEEFDYTTALQFIEDSFWNFCDNYLELVKIKAYQGKENSSSLSALSTLNWSLKTFLRLFAPFLPYITEEIWSWHYKEEKMSIHRASWPDPLELETVEIPEQEWSFGAISEILSKVRGAKTQEKVSLKTPVKKLIIEGEKGDLKVISSMLSYVAEVTHCETEPILAETDSLGEGDGRFKVSIKLGTPDQ